jgi:glycosyltransferase involved in cell wall biosynthesis
MELQFPFLVSIITVNLNNDLGLESTLKSIEKQSYKNIEVVLVDGGSTDQSLQIVKTYDTLITTSIIGQDSGIYDAMNIGLKNISIGSDFIIFLNSGDVFSGSEVIQTVMNQANPLENYYGNVLKNSLISYHNKRINLRGLASHMICHQALFFSSVLHRKLSYNILFTLAADYDLLIRAVKNKWKFNYVEVTVATLQVGGISTTHRVALMSQKNTIRSQHKKLMFWYYLHKIKSTFK